MASVIAGPSSRILQAALDVRVGLALWFREPDASLAPMLATLRCGTPFSHRGQGTPDEAVAAVLAQLPGARGLGPDMARLATLFARLAGGPAVRLQLTHLTDEPCPQLHVSAVGLRLLCTYAGRGTEWQDALGTIRRMPAFHVGVFKGLAWPDTAPRILHRSPATAHLGPGACGRLLLCIDRMELH